MISEVFGGLAMFYSFVQGILKRRSTISNCTIRKHFLCFIDTVIFGISCWVIVCLNMLSKILLLLSSLNLHCGYCLLPLRGYCTPDQFFDCLCIFLKNYNTLVTSKICFLKVTFQGTQLLHWNFTKSSGYWFMVQNMENIDFRTFFAVTSQQWPLLK